MIRPLDVNKLIRMRLDRNMKMSNGGVHVGRASANFELIKLHEKHVIAARVQWSVVSWTANLSQVRQYKSNWFRLKRMRPEIARSTPSSFDFQCVLLGVLRPIFSNNLRISRTWLQVVRSEHTKVNANIKAFARKDDLEWFHRSIWDGFGLRFGTRPIPSDM